MSAEVQRQIDGMPVKARGGVNGRQWMTDEPWHCTFVFLIDGAPAVTSPYTLGRQTAAHDFYDSIYITPQLDAYTNTLYVNEYRT